MPSPAQVHINSAIYFDLQNFFFLIPIPPPTDSQCIYNFKTLFWGFDLYD